MSTEPIPADIVEGALGRAHARDKRAKEEALDPKAVARRIKASAKAAKMTPKTYIDSLAEDAAKLTPAEGPERDVERKMERSPRPSGAG
ncbi:hypothetical protein AW27_014785 [Streptomyces sp. PCS3-D2]|uniref:hypothetical protein n=1 Tax=Streptomyces sp. PCS3-D2 TaxID=1460244 RepID=UPI0012FEEF9F|nr:hypothetical protein [Streptomyces sp. PCS3-D2]WKV72679.1 hypothetical protein AW27_014785 [Streptomyces sp. PCS3-D2]